MRRGSAGKLGRDRRVAGDQRAHLDAFAGERGGQRAGDVGEPAGLDQGKDFRGDREDFQLAHYASLSIIGWVIRRDAALGAAEALGVELGVLADDQAVGNAHAAVDDDVS